MKQIFMPLVLILLLMSTTMTEAAVPDSPANQTAMRSALEKITGDISHELSVLTRENEFSAGVLSRSGLSGDEATAILNAKMANVTYGHSSLVISPEGIIMAVSPSQYSDILGKDISYQPETQFANQQKSPVISNLFKMEEGFMGISVSYPIFSSDNQYLGYTDITILPSEFLRRIINPVTEQTGYDVFVIQKDGTTVYETNDEETGVNILTDPLYNSTEMQNVSRAVLGNRSGSITYSFWNRNWSRMIPREAVWDTLISGGQEWRIGVVRDRDLNGPSPGIVSPQKITNLNTSISDMTRFVKDAVEYAKKTDQVTANAAFNNRSGPYVSGDRYIFAYSMNGTCLALPYQEGLVGKNRMNLTDINGLAIMPALSDTAGRGGGSLYFVYPNPANNYQNQLKLYRIEPVSPEWFIGSGVYLPWVTPLVNQSSISALMDRVRDAAGHARMVGKNQATRDFNDMNGSYADREAYIFAYDYNGTTLSLPYQPEIIGTNRTGYTDMYGTRIISQEIDTAKNGGGFVYVIYYNPETTKDELKLCYVLPAGDDWLVGSGIYAGTGLEK